MAVIKVIQKDGTTKKFDTESKEYVTDDVKLTSEKLLEAKKKANKKASGDGSVSAEAYNALMDRVAKMEALLDSKKSLTKKAFNKLKAEDKEQYELSKDGKKYVLKGEQ